MTTTDAITLHTTPLARLEHDITDALTELRGARYEHEHCPSADNETTVQVAEHRLNRLLERRCALVD